MQLCVTDTTALTADVRLIRMAPPDGSLLPGFAPGSHLVVAFQVDDETLQRKYSLVSDPEGGAYYEIAVKRNPHGRKGSVFLHDRVAPGSMLEVSAPVSEFNMVADSRHYVLIAGGIGITPMLSMISALRRSGTSYELHYSARSRETMVFQDHLHAQDRDRVTLYFTGSDSFRRIDVDPLLTAHVADTQTHFYVCGPSALIDRVRLAAEAHGVAKQRVHFESFGPTWMPSDGPVKLALSESGIELEVATGTTLLDAMEAAGAWTASDCRRGECGACIATYTTGEAIHRDNCLTEEQRKHSFCPCVSWASSAEVLTLQL